jgi:hypothetical protein
MAHFRAIWTVITLATLAIATSRAYAAPSASSYNYARTRGANATVSDDVSPRLAASRLDSALARAAAFLEKVDFMYGIDWYRTRTSGNKTRSFKPDNVFQLHNTSLGYKDRFGEVAFDFQTALRWTNDFTITRSNDYKIQSIYGNFERAEKWGLRFGDIFPNFSPYTFTRSANSGSHGWYQHPIWGGAAKLSGAIGMTNREQEFTGGSEAGQYRRWASGASLDWTGDAIGFLGKTTAGFRFSNARDDGSSITSRLGSGGTPIAKMDIDVYSFKYEAALPMGVTWRGENAYSNGVRDMAAANPLHRYGHAHNSALDWRRPSEWGEPVRLGRVLPVSLRADYEWVDPDFLTELGSAAVDQLRWGLNSDHRWSDALDWTLSFIHNEDNVKDRPKTGTLSVTNISKTATFRTNMRPFELSRGLWNAPEHLRNLRYGFEFRRGARDASNATVNQKNEDYTHTIDYKNWGVNWNADYKLQLTDDDVNAANDRRVNDWGVRASRTFTYSIWEIRITPTASYRHSVDETIRGENLSRTQTANLGLGVAQGEFDFRAGVTFTDLDRNLRNADSLNKTYTASLGFRPLFAPGLNMNFTLRHSDVEEENKSNSFQQTEGRAHVDYRF